MSLLTTGLAAIGSMWLVIPFPIISLVLYTLLLIGHRNEKPAFYVPFMVIQTLLIVFFVGVGLFVVLSGSAMSAGGWLLSNRKKDQEAFGILGVVSIS